MIPYEPSVHAGDTPATTAIENGIGRYLIRTRPNEGVVALPADGLDYLFALHDDEAVLGPGG